ncbi:MAG: co-chaperone GroES [Gammaproteobacteria bacterium]|nr:co-chaperone GroES [Gammaproteobacteria bacterium]
MNIRPLHDRVVIKRLEEDSTSPGGIVIPDSAAEKPSRGKVLAVGNGKKLDDGKTLPLDVKVGDLVLFGTYSGTEFTLDNEKLLIMREDDISAVLKSK